MTGVAAPFPDRVTVAAGLSGLSETDRSFVRLLMENAARDDSLLDGLRHHLDSAANARFLNTLKLEKLGEWLGNAAPARLQIRLLEAAKSSQHAAYVAFKVGLARSGGLERAYPNAKECG